MKKSILSLLVACSFFIISCEEDAAKLTPELKMENSMAANKNRDVKRSYALDSDHSVIEWKGHSPAVSHHGAFAVSGPNIEVVNKKVVEGTFTIPIASITNFDLPDNIKPILLDHLKSPDFFNMLVYPEATFTISKVVPLPASAEEAVGGANYRISGEFGMIGSSHSITFPARIAFEGDKLELEAIFKIDRTRWGMNYAADPALGDRHIYPEVDIHLKLLGFKQ